MQNNRKITLGLDSSGPLLRVCAGDGEKIYSFHKAGIKQEQLLLPLLERTLQKAGAEMTDVKRIFFVRGPGRFTGIRISLTFASMLKYLNGAQVRSATVFEILQRQVLASRAYHVWKEAHPEGVVAVVLHAFRDEYFLQIFDGKNEPPQWLSKEQLLITLAARREPLFCAGTDKDGASLVALLGNQYRLAPMADSRVRPQTLIEMAEEEQFEKDALEPLYLKPARFELGR